MHLLNADPKFDQICCDVTKNLILSQVDKNLSSEGKVSMNYITELLGTFDEDMDLKNVPDLCASFIDDTSIYRQPEVIVEDPLLRSTWCPNLADLDPQLDDDNVFFERSSTSLSASQEEQQLVVVSNGMPPAFFYNCEAHYFNALVVSAVDFGGYLPWYHLYNIKSNVETFLDTFSPQSVPFHWEFASTLVNELRSRLDEYNLFHHCLIDVTSGHDSIYKSILVSIYLTQWFQRENTCRTTNSDLSPPINCLQLRRATMYFIMTHAYSVVNGLSISFLELFRRTHFVNGNTYMRTHPHHLHVLHDLEERFALIGNTTNYNKSVVAAWTLMRPNGTRTKDTTDEDVIEAMAVLETHKQLILTSQLTVFADLVTVCVAGFADEQAATTTSTDLHIAAVAEVIKCITINQFSTQHGRWVAWNSLQTNRYSMMTAPKQMSISVLHTTMPNHRQYFGSVDVSNANGNLSISPTLQEHCAKLSGLYEYQDIDIYNEDIMDNIRTNAEAFRQADSDTTNFVDFIPFPAEVVDVD
jgi:hypothetical protein